MPTKQATASPLWRQTLTEYWRQSRRPLVSLAFVLPLLLIYEAGVILLGTTAVRNGADVWLRQMLDVFGFGQYFLLPALTIGLLLAWHHVSCDRWQLAPWVLYVMFAECAAASAAAICRQIPIAIPYGSRPVSRMRCASVSPASSSIAMYAVPSASVLVPPT